MRGPPKRVLTAAVALVAVLGILGGCVTGPAPAGSPTSVDGATTTTTVSTTTVSGSTTSVPAALDDRLAGLVDADNRTAFAATHGLQYDHGRVRVTIELRAGADPPSGYDLRVVARNDDLVEAWVAVDALPDLAGASSVVSVRPTGSPGTAGGGS